MQTTDYIFGTSYIPRSAETAELIKFAAPPIKNPTRNIKAELITKLFGESVEESTTKLNQITPEYLRHFVAMDSGGK